MEKLIQVVMFFVVISTGFLNFTTAIPKIHVLELESGWTLKNINKNVSLSGLKLPSGVYSALKSLYGDILHSRNDDTLRWIALENWTYTAEFDIPKEDLDFTRRINLTFHGIDTNANIRLNGQNIGYTDNMFVRYSYDIRDQVKENRNILEIELISPILMADRLASDLEAQNLNFPPKCPPSVVNGVCNRNMLRKMQSSFGSETSLAAVSMGIWKTVTLEFYDIAIMRDVDIAARKSEKYWTLDIRIFLSSNIKSDFYGNLTFYAPDLFKDTIKFETRQIKYASLMESYTIDVPRNKVKEWWPNGYGEQKLYPFYFILKCFEEKENARFRNGWVTQKFLSYGFRTIELIEDEDDYGRSFYFKVNDHPIFIKGAVYLPSHILPEEESHISSTGRARVAHLLLSAKNSNLNMIRISGGGTYGSDYFYDLADSLGLLVWQDLPYTRATYPMAYKFVDSVRHETAQNAKRIAYRPSLAIIVTNDEIELYLVKNRTEFGSEAERLEEEYQQLFTGTIKHELSIISRYKYKPRPGPMLSTPSLGCEESKNYLPINPQDPNYGDVHFWPDEKEDAWDPSIYPSARFVSEFGFQSLPIYVSWNRVLGPGDTILDLIKHRYHDERSLQALIKVLKTHLPDLDLEADIDTFIYFSQVAQAIAVKTATEVFLSNRVNYRTMGAMYYQLNDVWIAPTWSSIDFYGNYKLLYYWSKRFFAPTSIIALKDEENNAMKVTLLRDGVVENAEDTDGAPRILNVTINTYLWSELFPQKSIIREEYLGNNVVKQFSISLDKIFMDSFTINNSFAEVTLSEAGEICASSIFLPGKIKDAIGVEDPQLTVAISDRPPIPNSPNNMYILGYSLTISVKKPAMFVNIEVFHPEIKKYELTDNGFIIMDPVRVIHLTFEYARNQLEKPLTEEHIKITTINQFLAEKTNLKPVVPETPETTDTTAISVTSSDFIDVYSDQAVV